MRRDDTQPVSNALPDEVLARAVATPLRRRILELIIASPEPVTVAELTEELGCNHNAVRQHLAQLQQAGLVTEMREQRTTPGRPRLLYTANERPDPYARLASLLLAARRAGVTPRAAGRRAGRAERSTSAADDAALVDALERDAARQGFAPRRVTRGARVELVLDTCPFAELAAEDPATVCALHRGFAEGFVEGSSVRVESFVAKDPYRAGCRIGLRKTRESG